MSVGEGAVNVGHDLTDFVRDVFAAIVSGLLLAGYFSNRTRRRRIAKRINRTWVELRHTQQKTDVEPFYEDSKNMDEDPIQE